MVTFDEYMEQRQQEFLATAELGAVISWAPKENRFGHHIHHGLLMNDVAKNLTDTQLIDLADGGVNHFGGRVDRWGNHVRIHVYID